MDSRYQDKLSSHLDSLDEKNLAEWKGSANRALKNEHDENHPDWEQMKSVAKWLGIPVGAGAAGGLWYIAKQVAKAISRH